MKACVAALLCAWLSTMAVASPPAVEEIAKVCSTGTLLFSHGDCLAVKVYTNSPYTHVAMVIERDGELYVYDSMNGVGVRCLTLAEYLHVQAPDRLHIYHPQRPLSVNEAEHLETYLRDQLDRPYSVTHHLTGKQGAGLHCSEYVTSALCEIDWLTAKNPARVSPASLEAGIVQSAVYEKGPTIAVAMKLEPIAEPESRCGKMWLATKLCFHNCVHRMTRSVLCQ